MMAKIVGKSHGRPYSLVPNTGGVPNEQGGLAYFFAYYMKNKGIFLKLLNEGSPYIRYLRVPAVEMIAK